MFPNANPLAVDLMVRTNCCWLAPCHLADKRALSFRQERCLTFSPRKRITVEDALAHPYLEPYHDPEDEPTAVPLDPNFFSFDYSKEQLSRGQLKQLIYQEIMS